MKYCTECGLKLPESIDEKGSIPKFCPRCGYNLTGEVRMDQTRPGYVRNTMPLSYGVWPAVALGALAGHRADGDCSDASSGLGVGAVAGVGDFSNFGDFGGFDGGGFGGDFGGFGGDCGGF